MSLPNNLKIYITSVDGTQRRRLPRANMESFSGTLDRYGGYGEGSLNTSVPYQQASALTVQAGDRLEAFYKGKRRYRGYVSAVSPSGEEPRKVVIQTLGVAALLRKVLCKKRYSYAMTGVDVSSAFADLAANFLLPATGVGGFSLIASVQTLPLGTTCSSLDAWNKLAGDVLDDLVQQTGNLAVWGVDVDDAGLNRLYMRPLAASSPPTHALAVPGVNVESAKAELQYGDIVTQLLIEGGSPQFPQLLHNGNFELPVLFESQQGSLIDNGDFELGASHAAFSWTLNAGASRELGKTGSPAHVQAFSGQAYLETDHTGENAVQTKTGVTYTAGHQYTFDFRACKEIALQTAYGHALLEILNSSGTTLTSVTVPVGDAGDGGTSSDRSLADAWTYFSGTFTMPAGASGQRVTLYADNVTAWFSAQGGICWDAVQLYDASVVYQDGWEAFAGIGCTINALSWAYQADKYDGAYCVYIDGVSAAADYHSIQLQPQNGAKFRVQEGQSLRLSAWMKSPPVAVNPNFPAVLLIFDWFDGAGNFLGQSRTTFAAPGGALSAWTYHEGIGVAPAGASQAWARWIMQSTGSALVDCLSVQDVNAQSAFGTNANTYYQPEGDLRFLISASDPNLPAGAPYAGSGASYGNARGAVLSEPSVLTITDALAVADAYFRANAAPYSRPTVTLMNDERLFWPGETVNLIGKDGPALQAGAALPIARVVENYDGLLKTQLQMEKEQPDVVLAVKKIVQDLLRKLGGAASSGGGAGGYSNPSNQNTGNIGGTAYRESLSASPTDPTLHDAFTGAPHASQASQDGWTATTAEVVATRTRTVLGVSFLTEEARLDAMEVDIAMSPASGLAIAESIGNGADLSLTTAYQTVPTIMVSVTANAASDADALVEIVEDAANANDDVYVRLYDTVAGAPIPFSEQHISYLPAGKSGQIVLAKYVSGATAGRTLVIQARNASGNRGKVKTNGSSLQVLGVSAGASTGGGINSPADVAGLVYWLHGSSITGLSDGAVVATWSDSSGNGHSATQATSGNQPTYVASSLNGKPGVRFNGTSSKMSLGDLSSFFPSEATVFVVATYATTQHQCILTTNTTSQDFWYFVNNGGGYYSLFKASRTASYPSSYGLPSTGAHLYSLVSGPSSWQMWVDQGAKDVLAADYSAGSVHTLGVNQDQTAWLSGDILEIVAYNSVLSDTDRLNVEAYLRAQYGI